MMEQKQLGAMQRWIFSLTIIFIAFNFLLTSFQVATELLFGPTIICLTLPGSDNYFAAYRDGKFIDGFHIANKRSNCFTRPIVESDSAKTEASLSTLNESHKNRISTGVFKISYFFAPCTAPPCSEENATVKKLSDNPGDLNKHKSEWKIKEWKGVFSEIGKNVPNIYPLILAVWMFILIKAKSTSTHKTFSIILWISYPIQLFMAFLLTSGIFGLFSYNIVPQVLFQATYYISQSIFILAAIIEIGLGAKLLYKKIRKADPPLQAVYDPSPPPIAENS